MMHWGHGFGWVAVICGGATLLLLGVLVVLAVIWLVRAPSERGSSGGSSSPVSETPLDILKARYARGEISREEYEEIREHLRT